MYHLAKLRRAWIAIPKITQVCRVICTPLRRQQLSDINRDRLGGTVPFNSKLSMGLRVARLVFRKRELHGEPHIHGTREHTWTQAHTHTCTETDTAWQSTPMCRRHLRPLGIICEQAHPHTLRQINAHIQELEDGKISVIFLWLIRSCRTVVTVRFLSFLRKPVCTALIIMIVITVAHRSINKFTRKVSGTFL